MAQKNYNKEICFTIDRFEGTKAVLKYENQELVLPKRLLDKDVNEGDVLVAEFITEEKLTQRKENLAKAILKEILQGE